MPSCDGKKKDCPKAITAGGWCIYTLNGECINGAREGQTNGTNA